MIYTFPRADAALCVDVLASEGYGEIIAGGQRLDDLDLLSSADAAPQGHELRQSGGECSPFGNQGTPRMRAGARARPAATRRRT